MREDRQRLCFAATALRSICLAVALVSARPTAASAEIGCAPVEGQCLNWHVHGPAFTPDNRYLYFSYRYATTQFEYSRAAIGRVALDSGKVEAVARSCDASYASPVFSPDGKLIAFAWAPVGGYPEIAYVVNTEQSIVDRASYITDLRSRSKDSPQFSPDGRFIYFTNNIVLTAQTISRFELASGKIEDVLGPSSLEAFFAKRISREYFFSVRNVRVVDVDGRAQLFFLGQRPHDFSLTKPLVEGPHGKEVKHDEYFYQYDLASRSVALDPINFRSDLREKGIHGFAINTDGRLIYTRSNYVVGRKGDLHALTLNEADAVPELYAALNETTFSFALSRDGRWIAQVWQKRFETREGRPLGSPIVLRLVDRQSGTVRDLDFGVAEFYSALALRCARQPWPQTPKRD